MISSLGIGLESFPVANARARCDLNTHIATWTHMSVIMFVVDSLIIFLKLQTCSSMTCLTVDPASFQPERRGLNSHFMDTIEDIHADSHGVVRREKL